MNIRNLILNATALVALASPVWANDGWERNSDYNKLYNAKNVVTVSGTVVSVNRDSRPLKGMQPGFTAVIQPASGKVVEVQLGPTWFTSFYHRDWNIQAGDQLTVTGSATQVGGHDVLMVSTGQKGEHKMTVRNRQGQPVWDVEVAGF